MSLTLLAQTSVPYSAARRGSELSQWAADHRILLFIVGLIVLIAIFALVARLKRDS